jgi:processive 1,2-diacylglycerol beta-glucosyltransferase
MTPRTPPSRPRGGRPRPPEAPGPRPGAPEGPSGRPLRVMVVSARMGAGHDGAARELRRRLEERGATCLCVDFLDAAPLTGRILRRAYELQLEAAPWSYEAIYRVWFALPQLCRPLVWLLGVLFGRRMRRWARGFGADAVVSTYPLASVVLGRDRRRGALRTPVGTFLTDFAVHPLWVHRGVDLHMCVHRRTAEKVRRDFGMRAVAPGPLVPDSFHQGLPRREAAREALGIEPPAGPDGRPRKVALVGAGSWGVGEVERTFDEILASGRYMPVALCGANDQLRKRLARRGGGMALGWTDRMPELMAAADVLVQNGGGLTCMEAYAAALPVVSFRPIPGHGRQNASDMRDAGVAAYAEHPSQLAAVLDAATTLHGRGLVRNALEMFRGDPALETLELAAAPARTPRARPVVRRIAAASVACAGALAGLNLAADGATAAGIGAAHPTSHATYLAVRLGPENIEDPALPALLSRAHATAIVEGDLALRHPAAVRRLASARVPLANGGWGAGGRFHLLAADDGVVRADEEIRRAAGLRACSYFAPDTPVTGLDLVAAHLEHERVVGPAVTVAPAAAGRDLRRGVIFVVDGERASTPALQRALANLDGVASTRHLSVVPLAKLT